MNTNTPDDMNTHAEMIEQLRKDFNSPGARTDRIANTWDATYNNAPTPSDFTEKMENERQIRARERNQH